MLACLLHRAMRKTMMRYRFLVLLLSLAVAAAFPAVQSDPQELADYIAQCKMCEHFRQEPWPEGTSSEETERRAFITGQLERYCKGAEQTRDALKRKYGSNRAVMERLQSYEAQFQTNP
jgi:hypothetical protein